MGRWWRYKWITFHPSLTVITEEFLTPLNMSHEALAQMMGVSCQVVEDIVYGRRRLTVVEASKLAVIFGTDEDFWSNLQALSDRR